MPTHALSLPPADLVARLDVPAPRYTSYPTADTWSDDVGPASTEAALERLAATPAAPLSLYVHLPFCRSLCLYCGCNVIIARSLATTDSYLAALAGEMDLVSARLGARRTVSQLHWGGGTPTFLDEPRLERLFADIRARFTFTADAEIAIEVDPRVTTVGQLRCLRRLGFNRLSLGVQDTNADVQTAIGRHQPLAITRALVDEARALGFGSIGFDLIYGLPHQTVPSWSATLEQILALAPDRVAVFSFAHVPALRPQQRRLPVAALPTGAAKLALLATAQEAFARAGYVAIGMDHFARPDDELARATRAGTLGRNFQGYTVRAASDVIGLGATAISHLDGALFAQNHRARAAYEGAIAAGRLATARGTHVSDDDRRRGAIIAGLMCNQAATLEERDRARYAPELAALAGLAADGLVRITEGTIAITPAGRAFARNVAMVFDAHAGARARRSRAI